MRTFFPQPGRPCVRATLGIQEAIAGVPAQLLWGATPLALAEAFHGP